MVGVTSPSGLETVLAEADGTVTSLLERLVGEPIDAEARGHRVATAASSNNLGVLEGHPLLCRVAELQGRSSGRAYVYAETVLVPSRLPAGVGPRLESSRQPIGRILETEGIRVTREPLAEPDRHAMSIWTDTVPPIEEVLLARTYRIHAGGVPVMVISEWFLTSLRPFLPPG
jgi:chorismate-pyruvate lyase